MSSYSVLQTIVVFGTLSLVLAAFTHNTTDIQGSGASITQNPISFNASTIISRITSTFDAYGLTSLKICYRSLISRNDGAVYANSEEECHLYGYESGTNSSDRFTADEWPTNVQPCISVDGIIQALNISTNFGNYWTAGDYMNCTRAHFNYSSANGTVIAIYGVGTSDRPSTLPPGIGSLQLAYFYCYVGSVCPYTLYNGGGPCGIRNGGCDLGVNCTNVEETVVCSGCSDGIPDSLNVCRAVRRDPQYSYSDVIPLNSFPSGTPFNNESVFWPPYKLSAFRAQFELVFGNITAATCFALTFQKVVEGVYDISTKQTIEVSGALANLYTVIYSQEIEFSESEWIVGFETSIVNYPSMLNFVNHAIGSVLLNTSRANYLMGGEIPADIFNSTQTQRFDGQIIVSVNGSKADIVDNLNFITAQCTQDCPTDPYASGICSTLPSTHCVGAYCQDTSAAWTCTCYESYFKVKSNDTICLPITDYCNSGVCATGVVCTATYDPYRYTCGTCLPGFTGSGYTQCQDINECLTQVCGTNRKCTNTLGNYTCGECNEGYQLVGNVCTDVDECAMLLCGTNRACTNTDGNYICGNCFSGYQLIGDFCSEIDWCANNTCGSYRECTNINGSYLCGDCVFGFQLTNGSCYDIDECKNKTCGDNRSCNNTQGSFECGDCYFGYQWNSTDCVDIDECANLSCGSNRICNNIPGSFACGDCFPGYQFNVTSLCDDINECERDECGANRYCNNTQGSYVCGDCFPKFTLYNATCIELITCESRQCGLYRECTNTDIGYMCGDCVFGYLLENNTCNDINECANHTCGANRACNNTLGGFTCGDCLPGCRVQDGACVEILKCSNDTCGANRICNDTDGSITCGSCFDGFLLINDSCKDIDECASNGCGFNRECANTEGSYSCGKCFFGYQLTNESCTEMDQCANESGCSLFATCFQAKGFSVCVCNDFYYGDGVHCIPMCGDGYCNTTTEDCLSCPLDCTSKYCRKCGDGFCDWTVNETCLSCPNDCGACNPKGCGSPPCNNQGTCYDGVCDCNSTWTGPFCADFTKPVDVDVSNRITMTTGQVSCVVSIDKIVEFNASMGRVWESLYPTNSSFTPRNISKSSNLQWSSETLLPNGAVLVVTIWQFEDEPFSYFSFAKTTTTFPPHTLKTTFQISSFPFQTPTNSLGIEMSLSVGSKSTSASSFQSVQSDKDKANNVRWASFSYLDVNLYGTFNGLALVDGRSRNITFSLNENIITATIPHFWYSAVVDPTFSVLLDAQGKSSNNNATIIAVAVSAVAIVLIIGVLVCVWPKISTWKRVRANKRKIREAEMEVLKSRSRANTIVHL